MTKMTPEEYERATSKELLERKMKKKASSSMIEEYKRMIEEYKRMQGV